MQSSFRGCTGDANELNKVSSSENSVGSSTPAPFSEPSTALVGDPKAFTGCEYSVAGLRLFGERVDEFEDMDLSLCREAAVCFPRRRLLPTSE